MGIHDRDYYREGGGGVFDGLGRQGVTVWLIVITCAVYAVQVFTYQKPDGGPVTTAAEYDPLRIAAGEVWRLLTYAFLHSSPIHLAANMLVLYWAGSRLEDRYGGPEFLLFYLAAGLFAGGVNFAAQSAGLVPLHRVIGASGAVTAVIVLYACHYPRQQILLFFVIPMPVWLVVVVFTGLDAAGVLRSDDRGIAYLVHLGGALFGLLYWQTGIRIASGIPRVPAGRSHPTPRLRIVPADRTSRPDRTPPPAPAPAPVAAGSAGEPATEVPIEARLDAVLAKISAHGQGSLTDEEREIFFRAGEVFKKRRK